jgi:hypothetical protein
LDVALAEGQPITDVWSIGVLTSSSKERIGYPTQKPEALLERIIKCASNEGDVVLDPFMGGGTTIAVADRLNRQWIGVDQSAMAVKVTELRLQKQADLFSSPIRCNSTNTTMTRSVTRTFSSSKAGLSSNSVEHPTSGSAATWALTEKRETAHRYR